MIKKSIISINVNGYNLPIKIPVFSDLLIKENTMLFCIWEMQLKITRFRMDNSKRMDKWYQKKYKLKMENSATAFTKEKLQRMPENRKKCINKAGCHGSHL